jgi:hypothetical protein
MFDRGVGNVDDGFGGVTKVWDRLGPSHWEYEWDEGLLAGCSWKQAGEAQRVVGVEGNAIVSVREVVFSQQERSGVSGRDSRRVPVKIRE